MGTVILLRHGRSSANTAGVLAGRGRGVHLDDHGREQVQAAAQRLTGVRVTRIVSSPLERCRQTAKAVAAVHPEVPLTTDRGLLEVDYGEWTGQELPALAKHPLWRTVQAHPSAVTFPGGESMAAMAARVVAAVRRLDAEVCAEHGDDAVWVAVSHGDPIKAVLADALGMHLDAFQRLVVDPASISVVTYTPLRPFVLMSNTHAGALERLNPAPRRRRRRSGEAAVGGGAGSDVPATPARPTAPRGARTRRR